MDWNETTGEILLNTSISTKNYCSKGFQGFWSDLEQVFLNINLVICVLGGVGNVINFLVFTSKPMRAQVVNIVLAGVSLGDFIVMVTYVPQFVGKSVKEEYPYYTAVAWILHEYFLTVFHHISIWFTVTLGLLRYVAIVHPLHAKYWCTIKRTRQIMMVVVLTNLLITIPGYMDAYIEEDEGLSYCGVRYCAKWRPINFLRQVEFWYQSISKIFPAIWLGFVTIRLIEALYRGQKKRQDMQGTEIGRKAKVPSLDKKNVSEANTTRMLVVVILLFLCTELPPSLLYILEIFFDKEFYFQCRRPLHYPILCMYYLSGAFNFVVYVTLSKNYRQSFLKALGLQMKESRNTMSLGSMVTGGSKLAEEQEAVEVVEIRS